MTTINDDKLCQLIPVSWCCAWLHCPAVSPPRLHDPPSQQCVVVYRGPWSPRHVLLRGAVAAERPLRCPAWPRCAAVSDAPTTV